MYFVVVVVVLFLASCVLLWNLVNLCESWIIPAHQVVTTYKEEAVSKAHGIEPST